MDSGWRESRWGRRDRNALGAAIRAVAGAPDLASAAGLIAEGAASLLRADRATVVRIGDDGPRVAGTTGAGAERVDDLVAPVGALAAALATADPGEVRSSGAAEVAAPIDVGGRLWGAIVASGAAARIPRHAHERLAPFADLVSLAAAAHEDRMRLTSLAGTDPLTGLGNRRAFDALLTTEVNRAGPPRRPAQPGAARHRPLQGRQRPLRSPARRPGADGGRPAAGRHRPARRGGDAHRGRGVRVDPPADHGRRRRGRRLRALLAIADPPFEGAGTLTISAGVCELSAAGGAEEMVRLADQMLYRAKADGRNAVRRHVRAQEMAGTT